MSTRISAVRSCTSIAQQRSTMGKPSRTKTCKPRLKKSFGSRYIVVFTLQSPIAQTLNIVMLAEG